MMVLVLGDNFEFFLQFSLVSITNYFLCNESSTKLFQMRKRYCSFEHFPGVYMTYELTDVHQCNKVGFPCCCFVCLFITSFHSFSTAAFASGINIAWCERSFAHTLGFPRQASLTDRYPELSEPFVTLGFPISIFYLCVHLQHLFVHPRFAEQNNIQSLYFLLPKSTLESISSSPGFRVTRRMWSHRYAVSPDETTCACFHL